MLLGYDVDIMRKLEPSAALLGQTPLQEELLSLEKLEAYMAELATNLKIRTRSKRSYSLRPELQKATRTLHECYQDLAAQIRDKKTVTPAAEWFVDNYHLIENQIREIRKNLPENYYHGLPQLAQGHWRGYPRVYALALAIIAQMDSRLESHSLQRILNAFQKVSPLQISELWALSLTLKVGLILHLSPLAQSILSARKNREKADALAEKLFNLASNPKTSREQVISLLTREVGPTEKIDRAFLVQLMQKLRDQEVDFGSAIEWLEQKLSEISTTLQQVAQLEHRRQATTQVTIGNIISSLRYLSELDWRDFFESVHLGENILRQDPSGSYEKMDFQTRDRYRHVIETIAKRSKLTELQVAQMAVEQSLKAGNSLPQNHIGYFLMGDGRPQLDRVCGYHSPMKERGLRFALRHPSPLYLGSAAALTVLFLLPIFSLLQFFQTSPGLAFIFCLLALAPASEMALSVLNFLIHLWISPKALPRMELPENHPAIASTVLVIPTLFTNEKSIQDLLEKLEIHWLANPLPKLRLALLADFVDADSEKLPSDEKLLTTARQGIENLNQKYSGLDSFLRFQLLTRKRQWNSSEGKWIAWERKRGKLHEFNRLLRGDTSTSFDDSTASSKNLGEIQYVLTLDSDTQIPRESVLKLLGTILHPLNQPQWDPDERRITQGYGILQPRISITSASAGATRFSRVSSGNIGLDPYTTAVSDIYQDLFAEGSFTGKGLYVVDAFEKSLHNRVPENTVLSHDLFEGSFARAALVTDVEFLDDYPSDFDKFLKRQHRWTRGDWQIASWIFPWVRNANQQRVRNDLSAISRWKIFDNLRRSLVPLFSLMWLAAAWMFLPGPALLWTSLIVLMYLFPVYSPAATGKWLRPGDVTWRGHFWSGWKNAQLKLGQILITLAFLPQQAWSQFDAIVRALYRMLISHQLKLEWVSHAQSETHPPSVVAVRDWLAPGPLAALLLFSGVLLTKPTALSSAFPFLLLWSSNPWLKSWLARRPPTHKKPLTDSETLQLREYARRTWHFFETFVVSAENWLAPDNFQEDPQPVVAHRTSPTNMGLQLLAMSSAYDLGYFGLLELLEKTEKTFQSMSRLSRMHGHFFNWYDTQKLEPLQPRYISTVDSGNLAGHLITYKQFLASLMENPRRNPQQLHAGLHDTFIQLQQRVTVTPVSANGIALKKKILENLDSLLTDQNQNFNQENWLHSAGQQLLEISQILRDWEFEVSDSSLQSVQNWLQSALRQIHEFKKDEAFFISPENSSLPIRLQALMEQCENFVQEMNFRFLYDEERKLFVIGFNVNDNRRDNSYYDLLASESRLASFVAIAKGDVDQEHWFRLGRRLTPVGNSRALIAWTATMFEYLMPLLVMKRYENSLLSQTYQAAVARQIEYGQQKSVPWGVSEAGYNARDLQMNYQYGPFGVPGLGLKRGLSDELVISPYSTFLAAMMEPKSALANLMKLRRMGAYSEYGFYESLDFTKERLPKNSSFVVLKSYMAHHQGMSLASINNILHQGLLQQRFHSDPLVKSTQILLQERLPQETSLSRPRAEEFRSSGYLHSFDPQPRSYLDVFLNLPRTQILSNGNYSVMVTSAGSGYSRSGDWAVTRWREDATRDQWGQYYYIRDRQSNRVWSVTHQPLLNAPDSYEAILGEEKVEFVRRDGDTLTRTEILVSPEDSVELRRISITNDSQEMRDYEITSYMETVLAKSRDDNAHPAFSNLFVQTEFLPHSTGLLATRRKRSATETQPWAFHVCSTEGAALGAIQYETDRSRFLGRMHSSQDPQVILEDRPLSNTVGSVLDPIFSLRRTLRVQPGETAVLLFATGFSLSREEALRWVDKYRDLSIFRRQAELAWTQSQVQLRHLNINASQAHTFQKLAGRILYLDSSLRASSTTLAQNTRTQSHLWAYGISGDLPILLLRIQDEKDISLLRELLHAHEYLRLKGLSLDFVVLNERSTSYLQGLQDEILRQVRISGAQSLLDKPGGIFLRRADLMPAEDLTLLRSVARVSLSADRGRLEEQLRLRKPRRELPPPLETQIKTTLAKSPALDAPPLDFFNSLGGFTADGREYVIQLKEGQSTPAPWCNVISNSRDFGFVVSESGSGYTWSVNSRENRLTPWSNDPISDPPGEIHYLRDEETGEIFSPTALPIRDSSNYLIRHRQGSTAFEHHSHGLHQSLEIFAALDADVKIHLFKLRNDSGRLRHLSLTSYFEWVLGFQKSQTSASVITELDPDTGALLARNSYNNEFGSRIAFADISETDRSFTCDRREFLGRNSSLSSPAALKRKNLSGTFGAGLDPCAALQTHFKLVPGEEKILVVILGQAINLQQAQAWIYQYRKPESALATFKEVEKFWDDKLSRIQVHTPDQAMNKLMNRWLLYQTLACRMWARSAFYQSGGAFGFRDQLQDSMAVLYCDPEITRQQILRSAARQFVEGDVQHWWHPPSGRGVRTHFSDDLLWLPFVVSFYIHLTGDKSILDETLPFLEGPQLQEGQEDLYLQPQITESESTLYDHCIRVLDRSLKVGSHGLPLMGSGDWNDGMNRVGHEGRGESVWVAWFLYATLEKFLNCVEARSDQDRISAYRNHMSSLKLALEQEAWDGDWYRRAFFDDGRPLGSSSNEECRIDSIAQSWAVLSGAADLQRSLRAMSAVDEHLIRRGDGLVQLFTPPFDKADVDPGYIKGYVPGVRENGGQYTHAAIWTVMAFAQLGEYEKATELFSLLNPINHALTRAGVHKYKVEPYVMAADIYGMAPHIGRGGWTWYTGSASWMFRAGLECLLGFELQGNRFRLRPKVSDSWSGFEIHYRFGKSLYRILARRSQQTETPPCQIDQCEHLPEWIPLVDDGQDHEVVIYFSR